MISLFLIFAFYYFSISVFFNFSISLFLYFRSLRVHFAFIVFVFSLLSSLLRSLRTQACIVLFSIRFAPLILTPRNSILIWNNGYLFKFNNFLLQSKCFGHANEKSYPCCQCHRTDILHMNNMLFKSLEAHLLIGSNSHIF